MRARMTKITAALAAVLLSGCGDRNLVLNADVLSYMDPSVTQFAFGPVPPVPGGLYTGEAVLVKDVHVNLIERPNDLAKVKSVTLTFAAEVNDSTGAGADTLRLYMSDESVDPLATAPVATLPIDMVDGQTSTVHVDVAGDQRLVDLFEGHSMRVTTTNSIRGPSSGPPLNGRAQFVEIRAVVVAGRQGL